MLGNYIPVTPKREIMKLLPLHFNHPPENIRPEIGERTMDWSGCMYEIQAVSLFGDDVFVKPLPQSCWSDEKRDWVDVYHFGQEPRWHDVTSLIPCAKRR